MRRGQRVTKAISGMLALAVVLVTVWAAGALLSPVPVLEAREQPPSLDAVGVDPAALALPAAGSSAVIAGAGDPVSAGDPAARPIAGIAKVVLAHVVLDASPLEPGALGPSTTITADDVTRLRALQASSVRTVPVVAGQAWTQYDLLAASVIGSGNNVAEVLAASVFGTVDGYLLAAAEWLAENALDDTVVVDPTGIGSGNVATAADMARLAQLTVADPVLLDLLITRPTASASVGSWSDNAAFPGGTGALGAATTYTDAAGVCTLLVVPIGETYAGVALLGQPDYPTAEAGVAGVLPGLATALQPLTIIEAGDPVGELVADWGQRTDLVATEAVTIIALDATGVELDYVLDERRTALRGTTIGRLTVTTPTSEQTVRLETATTITEPGVAWRFADPFTVLDRWLGESG